ncbi:MAG: DUF4293 domain-containing protein [Saprospiraceae bacterium]
MIQRIQSIFLLLAAAAIFGLFGLPFASTNEPVAASPLFADQKYNILDHTALLGLFVLAGLLCFLAIFLFKQRKWQMRLSIGAILGTLAGLAVTGVFFSQDSAAASASIGIGIGLPVIAIIFVMLAYQYIKKDEALVKSMDRLR